MNDNIFLDSNILVYCYSSTDTTKQVIARNLTMLNNINISTQVLNGTANVLYKKYGIKWSSIAELINNKLKIVNPFV